MFYDIFADDFKEMINTYFINKVFFQLFLHWSQQVRNIFHLLVVFKIGLYQAEENPEGDSKNKRTIEKSRSGKYFNVLIEQLYLLKLNQDEQLKGDDYTKYDYFEKMRAKLKQKEKVKRDESTLMD